MCDFGFARKLKENEFLEDYFGTLNYVAPEVINKQRYNHKADIWSLGVVTYELLTGFHPFNS